MRRDAQEARQRSRDELARVHFGMLYIYIYIMSPINTSYIAILCVGASIGNYC